MSSLLWENSLSLPLLNCGQFDSLTLNDLILDEGFGIVKIEEAIIELAAKAAKEPAAGCAAMYAQAALNLANAANILRALNLAKECLSEIQNQK